MIFIVEKIELRKLNKINFSLKYKNCYEITQIFFST